jgi:hypothetical protein
VDGAEEGDAKPNEAASADEAKEESKSNEVEKGVVERPDVGV